MADATWAFLKEENRGKAHKRNTKDKFLAQ